MKARNALLAIVASLVLCNCKKNQETTPTPDASSYLNARYSVAGTMIDYTGTFTGNYPQEIVLEKSGTNQGTMIPKALGIPGHLIYSMANASYYGNFGIVVTIDPSTYKITAMTNHYGQPSTNGRSAVLDPSGINALDPATKTIRIKYWMDEPAVYTPHRTAFDETWTYLGPK